MIEDTMDVETYIDHELGHRLIPVHPPRDPDIEDRMDAIRTAVLDMAYLVIDTVPRSPDRTVAIKAIRQAGQHAIAALACHSESTP